MYQLKKEPINGVVIPCSFYFSCVQIVIKKHKMFNLPPELLSTLQSISVKHVLRVM